MDPTPLTGREAHRAALTDAISDARNGRARTVTVVGEAGSGKTALLDAVVEAAPDDVRPLRISGHPAEQDLPFAGVHQLVHHAGLEDVIPTPEAVDSVRGAAALLGALTTLARRGPLLLVVDDAQWLDRLSRRALVFVARRLDADAVCMLFAARSPDPDLLSLGERLDVGPLTTAESLELLRRTYPGLSARVAAKVAAHAHGIPLALHEIPADLTAAQQLGVEPLPVELPLGRSLTRLFTERISSLPDATRLCLLAASFEPLTPEAYRSTLVDLGCRQDDLDAAERVGLARVRGWRCEFRHPLVAAATRAEARSQELVVVHRALATRFADDPIRFAAHVRHDPDVDPDARLRALRVGATAATAAKRYDEAAELWSAAADQAVDPSDRRSSMRSAVRCMALGGSGPEARALIEELLTDASGTSERAHLLRDLMWVAMWTRSVAPDRDEAVARGVELLNAEDPESRALGRDLLTTLATAMLGAGAYRRAGTVSRVLATADLLTIEQRLLCDAIGAINGEPGTATLLRRSDQWVDSYPWDHILDPAAPTGFIAVMLDWLGEHDAVDRVIARCRRIVDERGPSASSLVIVGSMSASRERREGRWDRARHEYESLEQLIIDTDFIAPYPFIALRHAHLLAAIGDVDGCELLRRRAREHAPDWLPALAHLDHAVAGLLALAYRELETALDHLDRAAQIERDIGLVTSGYLSRFADAYEAAWRLGTAGSRHSELARFEDAMRSVRHRGMLGLVARCRALTADPGEMDARFERSVRLLRHDPDGFETARTYLLWGERLRRARRKADAHGKLSAAHAVFTRLGATPWAARCAAEMAACGIRRVDPAVAVGGPVAQLTPREFEVAREVAAGSSNADAARRLFISERTVEFHLYNTFRKLGIDRREDLPAIIDA